MDRRRFLRHMTLVSGSTLLPTLTGYGSSDSADTHFFDTDSDPTFGAVEFLHGVASGDPLPDAVILWTRVTPMDPLSPTVRVAWELGLEQELVRPVLSGRVDTTPERDYTVKVDVSGLEPGQTYYYRFCVGDQLSPVGRTRTAPTGTVEHLRLGFVTCGDYARGLFNVYRRVAERDDLQAVVHLGDYIYENDRDDVRPHDPPHELVTLADYRRRYAQYRSDPDLQALHRQHPMIWVWDDHELANDSWRNGAEDHDPATDGDFWLRRASAFQAAHEWLPIRTPDPADLSRIYRRFAFGELLDLIMIDARQVGRDEPLPPNSLLGEEVPVFTQTGEFTDPARQILGAEQEQWLIEQLRASRARWRILGNQVYFSPLKVLGTPRALEGGGLYLSNDKWDGYAPARDRALAVIAEVGNVVIMTGDAHEAYAFDVHDDPNNPLVYNRLTGEGSKAVEFVVTSATTRGDGVIGNSLSARLQRLPENLEQLLHLTNPHLKYYNNRLNGYCLVDIDAERVRNEFWFVPMVSQPTDEESLGAVFECAHGTQRLQRSA